jgi:hypothetical protein
MLKSFSPSPIYSGYGKYPFCRFITRIHPYLEELYKKFYPRGVKVIPREVNEFLKSPLCLAIYFMDDGTVDKRRGSMLFETQSFSRRQIQRLGGCLFRNFNLRTSIHRSGKGRGERLYLPIAEAKLLRKLVEPHILSCMKYKLLLPL